MPSLANTRDAKDFLVDRICSEAQCEGVTLSDIERKMMYFSDDDSPDSDMGEVNSAFDRDYDQDEYEKKVGKLARAALATARAQGSAEFEAWKDAVDFLQNGDHYLLVLLSTPGDPAPRPRGDFLKLIATALAIVAALLVILFYLADR